MMEIEKPRISFVERDNGAKATITVEPLEKGFGITIGNSLRRVLLSSLPGTAVRGIKIKNVLHEFSAIHGVTEDVTVSYTSILAASISGIPMKIPP